MKVALFYNKENVGDVLILKMNDEIPTSFKKCNDIVALYKNESLIGYNFFNISSYTNELVNGINYNPSNELIELINDKIRKNNLAKKIICTSSVVSNEIFRSLNFLNIDYFFLKPYDIKSLFYIMKIIMKGTENTILIKYIDSYNECSSDEMTKKNRKKDKLRIEEKVTILLHNIGIPAHIKGYVYIRCAIIESFYNPMYIGQITKSLYPEIARRYSSTPSRVERAIRHAIEIAWNRGSVDLIDKIFGYTINAFKAKPTNSEFIAMLTDKLRLELKTTVMI